MHFSFNDSEGDLTGYCQHFWPLGDHVLNQVTFVCIVWAWRGFISLIC